MYVTTNNVMALWDMEVEKRETHVIDEDHIGMTDCG
jgi:hypothetical protein